MKSYNEIADSIFERRDKYEAAKKRKRKVIISSAIPTFCCIALAAAFALHGSIFSGNSVPVLSSSKCSPASTDTASSNNSQGSHSEINNSQAAASPSVPSDSVDSSQGETFDGVPSYSNEDIPDESYNSAPSNTVPAAPPTEEANYFIDSIDKINFYSAKKVISEKSLLPVKMNTGVFPRSSFILLNGKYYEYPIDRSRVYTTTMVTYFTAVLNDKNGFLAQALGGTGLIEIVVTENDIEDMGQLITFKRENRYYTCLMNSQSNAPSSDRVTREFSTHKYIDGFNIVKNFEQENYKFTVEYEGSKVVGFKCEPFKSVPSKYTADDITLIEDFCVVIYTRQEFTVDELEMYFKNENTEGML